jgi:hypothetical protein
MNPHAFSKPIPAILGAAIALAITVTTVPARAAALHAFCAGTTPACTENVTNTNTPTSTNPPTFGFWDASGGKGTLWLDFLFPNNEVNTSLLKSFALSGGLYTANLFSPTAWTTGPLDSYLGISASPANPIGAYLTSTKALDAGATGFYVYQADIGSVTLPGSSTGAPTFTLSSPIPLASYIVGFLEQVCTGNKKNSVCTPSYTATANSAALFETGKPLSPVPEPQTYAMWLAGLGLIGFTIYRRKNNSSGKLMAA